MVTLVVCDVVDDDNGTKEQKQEDFDNNQLQWWGGGGRWGRYLMINADYDVEKED